MIAAPLVFPAPLSDEEKRRANRAVRAFAALEAPTRERVLRHLEHHAHAHVPALFADPGWAQRVRASHKLDATIAAIAAAPDAFVTVKGLARALRVPVPIARDRLARLVRTGRVVRCWRGAYELPATLP